MQNIKNFLAKSNIKNILFAFPHPDDESFVTGGLITTCRKMGIKVDLLCLTNGSSGKSKLVPQKELAKVRVNELYAACDVLGVLTVILKDLPDSKLIDSRTGVETEVFQAINTKKPDLVVTYGPDGLTGHPDHIVTSEIILKVCKALNISLLFFTPNKLQKRYITNNAVNLAVESNIKVSNFGNIVKARAIFCHKSQLDMLSGFQRFGLYLIMMFMPEEYHIVDLSKDYEYKIVAYQF